MRFFLQSKKVKLSSYFIKGLIMKKLLFVLLTSLLLAACLSTPVHNVENAQVPTGLTKAEVEKSVVIALLKKGWIIKQKSEGKVLANIVVRSHTATIEVTFDEHNYSINYIDSNNLKYNHKKGTIHKNYNNWIHNIDRLINVALVEETYKKQQS